MRLSDLRDKPVRSVDGARLGRVHDVHVDKGRVTALMCGAASFIERLTGRTKGRRIPWESVVRVEPDAILVDASASRSRRGTRQASARRSGR
jgi:sporulation protein YlmC with PRC-barrel domain